MEKFGEQIQEYQIVSPLDEEELSLNYADSEDEIKDEIKDEIAQDGNNLNEGNHEVGISNQDESILPSKNDEYTDISDDNNSEN